MWVDGVDEVEQQQENENRCEILGKSRKTSTNFYFIQVLSH